LDALHHLLPLVATPVDAAKVDKFMTWVTQIFTVRVILAWFWSFGWSLRLIERVLSDKIDELYKFRGQQYDDKVFNNLIEGIFPFINVKWKRNTNRLQLFGTDQEDATATKNVRDLHYMYLYIAFVEFPGANWNNRRYVGCQ
jgi:hypothetical protein